MVFLKELLERIIYNFEKKISRRQKNPKIISMQIVKLNNTDSISQSSEDQYCVLYNIQDPNPVIIRGTVKTHVRQSIANLCSAETDLSK